MTTHINLTLTLAEWEFLITLLNQELDDIEEYDELGREHLKSISLKVKSLCPVVTIPIKCDSCEEVKICKYVEDPYAKEINSESIWRFMCDTCFEDSLMSV